MKRLILSVLISTAIFSAAQAQGKVTETVDPKVAQMMKRFVELNKSNKNIKGWRIQILATTDRQKMENALSQFQSFYPSIPADWIHNKPYYKIRVGDFRNKIEAMELYKKLLAEFGEAIIIQDKINLPKL